MSKGVIFDLDGVLVSTDELHFKAWSTLAEELGIVGFTHKDNLRQRGVGRMESLEVLLEKSDRQYSVLEKKELAARKNDYYVGMLKTLDGKSPLPGSREALRLLRGMGVRIAVGSSSRNARTILEKTGLAPFLDAVADGDDAIRSKPDPQIFLAAAKKLGLTPGDCLVVEDSDSGVEAGVSAGMRVLGVGPAAKNPLCDFSAASLADPIIDWSDMLGAM